MPRRAAEAPLTVTANNNTNNFIIFLLQWFVNQNSGNMQLFAMITLSPFRCHKELSPKTVSSPHLTSFSHSRAHPLHSHLDHDSRYYPSSSAHVGNSNTYKLLCTPFIYRHFNIIQLRSNKSPNRRHH